MPTRYLKAGICDSSHIESIPSDAAEVLYYRLLVTVDDFGRYDARPAVIKARCFPLREDLPSKQVDDWLLELAQAELVWLYEVNGQPYLQVQRWDNKPRAAESRFPQVPVNADGCMQLRASVQHLHTSVQQLHTDVPLTVTVTGTETRASQTPPATAKPRRPSALNGAFTEFWERYPRKKSKGQAEKAWVSIKPDEQLQDRILTAVERAKTSADWRRDGGKFIPYPASWLNAKGWEDEAQVRLPMHEPDRIPI